MKISPVTVAIAAVLGTLSTAFLGMNALFLILAFFICGFCVYTAVRHKFDVGFLILFSAFILASGAYIISTGTLTHKTLNYTNKYVTLEGYTVSPARENSYSENFSYLFKVETVSNRNGTADTAETILLSSPQKIECGKRITVKGIVKPFPKKMTDGAFNTELYYKSQNIFTRMYSEDISINDGPFVFTLRSAGGKLCEYIDNLIYSHYQGDGAAILSAIVTGSKHHFSREYNSALIATAFKKIFHPAYLHMWLIILAIEALSHIINRKYRDVIIAVVFTCYAVVQCGNIGFSRCMICCAISAVSRLWRGNMYFPDTLATVILICTAVAPTMLFNTAFVMSVICGFMVWAFVPYIMRHIEFIPKRLRRMTALMLVFAFFVTPVTIYFYRSICIYALFAPFVTMPIVLFALLLTPVVLLLLQAFGTASFLGAYLNLMIRILYKLPFIIKRLPLSQINFNQPSLCMAAVIVFFVSAAYFYIYKRGRKHSICFCLALGLLFADVITQVRKTGMTEFAFVNVGQGDGSVIRSYTNETIIIDGGGGFSVDAYDEGEMLFVPYLENIGINRIDTAIVSHYHQDHIQGVISAINQIDTKTVFAPKIQDSDSSTMKYWANELYDAARKNGTQIYYIDKPTRLEFDGGLKIDILTAEGKDERQKENDSSLPVRIQYGSFSVMYAGDLTEYAERSLVGKADLKSDILKVAHHGSKTSSSEEFVSAVSPKFSVISCGENNLYSHPNEETLKRLSASTVLRTDELGDITVWARKNGKFFVET